MAASDRRKSGASWAKNIGAFLPKLTKPAFEKFGFPAATLVTDWATIAGRDLASYTAPERLSWPPAQSRPTGGHEPTAGNTGQKSGATLTLRVEGPRAIEVQFKAQQIIERINTYFGYRAVTAIRIVQAPLGKLEKVDLSPKKPARQVSTLEVEKIENERLRAALAKLADGVAHR